MRNVNFVYWLEGLIENVELEELNEKQFTNIVEHLKLVEKVEKLSGFPLWLSGFMQAQQALGMKRLDKTSTDILKSELKKVVINVMDEQGFNPGLLEKIPGRVRGSDFAIC